jgi:hypothetical protein
VNLRALRSAVLAGAVASLASSGLNGQEKTTAEVSGEAYAVYSTVLSEEYGSWFKGKGSVAIIPHTVLEPQGHPSYESCQQEFVKDDVWRSLFDKMTAEKAKFRIEARLRLPGKYKMQAAKGGESAVLFFLSAVEFSPDGSKAMVLAAHHCGALCGGGLVRELVKTKGSWHMIKDQPNCGWIN